MTYVSEQTNPNAEPSVVLPSDANWPFAGLQRAHYRVIVADPAWKFSTGPSRNPSNHYRTMSIREIKALPVRELAHPDGARLILWVPFRSVHQAIEVINVWGFQVLQGPSVVEAMA